MLEFEDHLFNADKVVLRFHPGWSSATLIVNGVRFSSTDFDVRLD